ncbi:MAG: hypothetical protein KJ620_07055 [Candidatus Edwardsbacteria bacterium]|nr:hypothetical protein [Candidatus Edwardsbacteria bacterium]MBU1577625.1 hypothetical protein [Candidatus Edwardsbacteria bacterium]MBU2462964.1 hypothetical protein [Candidatus Edwardsbacteria bacterium]MBU2595095.1 hypothetical protein [Candidatus Edwardsbacteria bacterium]
MRAKVLTVLVLLVMASAALAQAPVEQTYPWYNSFRNQSTAGLLEDNLDLMLGRWGFLDPARIDLIDGKYLYTNLANIYNKNEEQFNPSDAGTYVVGGTSDIFGYGKLGLLYSRNYIMEADSQVVENVTLTDIDPGTNPGYDYRETTKEEDQWQGQEGKTDYFLGYARQVNDMRLGLAFKRTVESYKEDGFATWDLLEQNIITGQTIYTEAGSDTGSFAEISSENWIGASVWKPMNDKMDLSLRLAIGMGGIDMLEEYDYIYNEAVPGGDSYGETETETRDITYSGTAFSGGGAYVYKWTDDVNTRFDLQFTHMGYTAEDATFEGAYHEQSVSISSDYYTDSYTEAVTGEYTQNQIDFRMVNTAKLEKAVFAIGLGFTTSGTEMTGTSDRADRTVSEYRFMNNTSLPTSYVATTTRGETWEYKVTEAGYLLSLPVGVEFNLTDNIVFRLGADHQISNFDFTDNETLTGGSEMETTVTRMGDGSTTTTYTPNPLDDVTGVSQTYKEAYSYTNYTYGAGWKVTPNLQLDFMGFAQLNDLTNWKLSAVFKF